MLIKVLLEEHQDQILQLILVYSRPLEIYLQKLKRVELEAMGLDAFHLMLKEVDVKHVKEMG